MVQILRWPRVITLAAVATSFVMNQSAALAARPAPRPVITVNPANQSAIATAKVTFLASATTGQAQWLSSSDQGATWTPISGATTKRLTLTATNALNGTEFEASFTNSSGTAFTTSATLTVQPLRAPVITANPTSDSAAPIGTVATFSAAATGTPAARVSWYCSKDGGVTWLGINSHGQTTLSVAVTSLKQDGYDYRAQFTNSQGTATSSIATLGVSHLLPPTVVDNPFNATVVAGTSASFSASSSDPHAAIQWRTSADHGATWVAVAGATSPTLTLPNVTLAMSGLLVEAVFSNASGSVTSKASSLFVTAPIPLFPTIARQPTAQSVLNGQSATFSAVVNGTPAPSAQWYVSTNKGSTWNLVVGATSPSLTLTPSLLDNGNEYEVVFTNSLGEATSNAVLLYVVNPLATSDLNWSGYVATGQTFSAVSGDWTVPTVTCATTAMSSTSQWIGIDGVGGTPTVEQTGTSARCINGAPFYEAWWEMFGDYTAPDGSAYFDVGLPIATYPVNAGDQMSASVSTADGTWTLTVSDLTQDWSYTKLVSGASPVPSQSSAEWVVERSGDTIAGVPGLAVMASISPVTFTNADATGGSITGSISAFTNQAWQVLDPATANPWATPGTLSPDGTSFSVAVTCPIS